MTQHWNIQFSPVKSPAIRYMPDHFLQKQFLRCRSQGKKRRPGGTLLQWIEVISTDLGGVANWQEVVKDFPTGRDVVRQPKPVTVYQHYYIF